jgi:hypothetical protein
MQLQRDANTIHFRYIDLALDINKWLILDTREKGATFFVPYKVV